MVKIKKEDWKMVGDKKKIRKMVKIKKKKIRKMVKMKKKIRKMVQD